MHDESVTPAPTIAVVLPRGMRFSPATATSIDSVVYSHWRHSPLKDSVTVFVQPVENGDYFDGVKLQVVKPDAKGFGGRQGRWLKACIRALRALSPDVIGVHQHVPSALALARAFPAVPVVLVRHHILSDLGWWKRLCFRRLAAVVSVSDYVRRTVREATGLPEDRLFVVPNGMERRPMPEVEERQPCIVAAGRFRAEKGWLPLAEALAKVLPDFPRWSALWFTLEDAPDAAFHAAVTAALAPVRHRIDWRQSRPVAEVREAMAVSEVACVPSLISEAFGLTALEAHTGGAVLISSGIGGLREVSDEAALYSEVTAEGLAEALRRLLGDADLREALRRAGYRRAERFDAAAVAQCQAEVWLQILRRSV